MTIGFGSTEIAAAREIVNACADAMLDTGVIAAVQKQYMEASKRYKDLPAEEVPERYSYFWAMVYQLLPPLPEYDDKGKSLTTFTIHHINRRHALSPDGWAALETKWALILDGEDRTIYREV